jgi:hypothetical protein
MKKLRRNGVWLAVFILLVPLSVLYSDDNIGSYENPIIDSGMSTEQAFNGLSSNCPLSIKKNNV